MGAFDLRSGQGATSTTGMSRFIQRLGPTAALTLATALAYGCAAWGGLTLLTGTSGIAIFWPASGLSAGLAIAIGRTGYPAIALGTVLATIVVNLFFGRDLWLSAGFGLLNAGETLLIARLLEFVPVQAQAIRRLMRVLAFFACAIAATAAAGLGAALLLIYGTQHTHDAAILDLWRVWFLSDLVGVIVIAPFLIALHELATTPELRRTHDWKADVTVLIPFVIVAYHTLCLRLDDSTWVAIVPGAALLPLLLWLSARSQPIVPALAIAMLALMMAWLAAGGTGRFGDVRFPPEARIIAAQVALTGAAVVAQVVLALYTDRRLAVMRLKASEMRLAAIVDTAPGVIFSAETRPDGMVSFPFVSSTSSEMLGIPSERLATDPSSLLDLLAPGDRRALLDAFHTANDEDAVLSLELPLARRGSGETWIEIKARPVREGERRVVWHGFIQDVTMRRRLVEELGHRTRNLLSVTQAIAEHTARHTPPDALANVLAERLAGLAASHQLLIAHRWESAELEVLARAQLSHLSDLFDRRLEIDGPSVFLEPQAAQIIGMALHELATNSCKYGALATDHGTIRLSWTMAEYPGDDIFQMCWEEQGGGAFPAAAQNGFGSKVTVDMPTYQLKAKVCVEPRVDGLAWTLAAPAKYVVRKAQRRDGSSGADREHSIDSPRPMVADRAKKLA
ncbi:MAG: MASE1 domain-containing protein [Hyphomicrobiaceae bacterium]